MNSDDTLSVTEATNQGVSKLVNTARDGRRMVVTQNSTPAAAVVDIPTLERLQHIEELEDDARLLSLVLARRVTDNGARYDLDEVVDELGIDEK